MAVCSRCGRECWPDEVHLTYGGEERRSRVQVGLTAHFAKPIRVTLCGVPLSREEAIMTATLYTWDDAGERVPFFTDLAALKEMLLQETTGGPAQGGHQ